VEKKHRRRRANPRGARVYNNYYGNSVERMRFSSENLNIINKWEKKKINRKNETGFYAKPLGCVPRQLGGHYLIYVARCPDYYTRI